MVLEKVAIDGLAASKPVLNVMPEADARFTKTPAQIYFAVSVKGWEINQPGIRILDLDAHFRDLLDYRFQRTRRRVLAGARSKYPLTRQRYAAQESDAVFERIEFRFARIVILFRLHEAPDQTLDFG